jgi:putative transposase
LPYSLNMSRKAQPLTLSRNDIRSLKTLLTRGTASARTLSRARILDLLHRGLAPADIAPLLQVAPQTVFNVKRRYLAGGLQAALYDQPRSGRPPDISGTQRAKITALACTTPPAGRARWTLRLLADKVVELGYCESLSHTTARKILKKTNSSRT